MKLKYLLTAAVAGLGLLSSCNMDLTPASALDMDEAIESVSDCMAFRNGLYGSARGVTTSSFFSYVDIQCDMFNGLTINGNRMGAIANGNIYSNNSEPEGYWYAMWGFVANCNYFLDKASIVYDRYVAENDEANAARVSLYISEAHFFRGYMYALMFDRWCVEYEPSLLDQPGMGLPIVTKLNPTANRNEYIGRSTMKETLDFMQNDLQIAYNGLKAWEANNKGETDRLGPNAVYVSSWCVKALQARIALWLKDYETAKALSQEVINCGLYKLCESKDYKNMWLKDLSNENIYLPFESLNELGSAQGGVWVNNESGADYIPSSTVIQDLRAAGQETDAVGRVKGYRDVRYGAFIEDKALKSEFGQIKAPVFMKYPGNPTLQSGQGGKEYRNRPKPFRLSEQYFILAEAAYELGDETLANATLKTYMSKRINYEKGTGYVEKTGTELRDEIRLQRGLEFIGEGFRLSDLRRWQQSFRRTTGIDYATIGYGAVDQILTRVGIEVSYLADDHRYTWPIPSSELQVNPQMQGQQNPGY